MICGYINGQFCQREELSLSVFDLGLLRGYGVFEYFRTYYKKPFFLLERMKRLELSAKALYLTLPKNFAEIPYILQKLLDDWKEPEATIRMIVTGGVSSDGMNISPETSLIIFLNHLPLFPRELYERGISALTFAEKRFLPQAKTLFYVPAISLLNEAKAKGAQEALYLNPKKEILEGTTSNFLAIKGKHLVVSRKEEILSGITRSIVMQLAQDFEIEERNLHLEELAEIEEAFLTSSIREIVPIVNINQTRVGSGKPGPKTQKLYQNFKELTQRNQDLSNSLLMSR